jgi:hypothetical protein
MVNTPAASPCAATRGNQAICAAGPGKSTCPVPHLQFQCGGGARLRIRCRRWQPDKLRTAPAACYGRSGLRGAEARRSAAPRFSSAWVVVLVTVLGRRPPKALRHVTPPRLHCGGSRPGRGPGTGQGKVPCSVMPMHAGPRMSVVYPAKQWPGSAAAGMERMMPSCCSPARCCPARRLPLAHWPPPTAGRRRRWARVPRSPRTGSGRLGRR